MGHPRWSALQWETDHDLTVDGIRFWLTTTDYQTPSTPERFVLLKHRGMIEAYVATFALRSPLAQVLELGFFHGASTVFFDRLLEPRKLVAVDAVRDAPYLEQYRRHHQPSRIVPYYGLAQQDRGAMLAMLTREFPDRTLDLVIDDASHEYAATRTAFETVWPFLSVGASMSLKIGPGPIGLSPGRPPIRHSFPARRSPI